MKKRSWLDFLRHGMFLLFEPRGRRHHYRKIWELDFPENVADAIHEDMEKIGSDLYRAIGRIESLTQESKPKE